MIIEKNTRFKIKKIKKLVNLRIADLRAHIRTYRHIVENDCFFPYYCGLNCILEDNSFEIEIQHILSFEVGAVCALISFIQKRVYNK